MSKFFEVLKGGAVGINGDALPFTAEELRDRRAEAAASGEPKPEPVTPPATTAYHALPIRVETGGPLLPFDGTHSEAAERYRIIRTKIAQHPAHPRVICVSSAGPGDGKTVNALNIASSLALKTDTTVILVDGDLRRPRLAPLLGVPESPGLAEYLAGRCTLAEAVVEITALPGLYLLRGGQCAANPAELLDSARWRSMVESLRAEFSFVVLDTPPIGLVTDYDLIREVSDGIVVIVRPGHSNRKLVYKALEQIPRDKLIGVVINCAEDWLLWHSRNGYYGYGYGYGYDPKSH